MLDMCNYFFSNFQNVYKMSVAKVKVAQNRNVCDQSQNNCRLCSLHILYSLREHKNIAKLQYILCAIFGTIKEVCCEKKIT